MKAMPDGPDDELALARAETRVLTDQLRQARADLHRLGIADQNRALLHAAVSGAIGLVTGVAIGLSISKKRA